METENKIVEYVECIKGDGNESYNIVGNIYKVKDYNPRTGELCLYVYDHSISNIFFGEESKIRYNNTDYKPSTKEAFENHILKQQMKTITHNQAQQIIDIACPTWKEKLFTLWGKNIVLKQEITISEVSYKEMRNACTDKQDRLFDEIFGKDIKFKVGDWVCTIGEDSFVAQIIEQCELYSHLWRLDKMSHFTFHEGNLRHATEEEIQKAKYIPEGTPCLVRDCDSQSWRLSYSKGDGRFKMASDVIIKWKYVKVLDINNLPTY
jgi:hypothetical protein